MENMSVVLDGMSDSTTVFEEELTTVVLTNSTGYTNQTTAATPAGVSFDLSGSELASVIIYWGIGILGLIGNTLVCVIFGLLKQRRSQVNLYILNQAFADLATSFLLIAFGTTRVYKARIATDGGFGEFLCRFWWSRFFLFSCFAISAHNLTLMSVERYVAVVHPLQYGKLFTRRNTKISILMVWLIAPIMQYIFVIFQYTVSEGRCATQPSWSPTAGTAAGVTLFVWEYFMPCSIMSYAYTTIVRTLQKKERALAVSHRQNSEAASTRGPSKGPQARRRNVTVTLFTVFIVYVLCWTPNQFTFLQFNLGGTLNFDGPWYLITVIAAFLNSCSNPFVYALMHKQFQAGLKLLARCRKSNAVADSTHDRSINGTVLD
ncbi:galanin receptor type 1-like [Asterias rubens]|uniref:galanin receptor type 1-like n=1 Tax=Asterias rubens TaxID=7604 RepID=UPI0014559CAE|nr:galanin receptor type 1-like [Asterias rubens]